MNTIQTRTRLILSLIAAAGLSIASGCASRGYTKEASNAAQQRAIQFRGGVQLSMAQQQFLAGDLDKALKTVDGVIAANPQVAAAHVLRGRVLSERGALEESRRSFLTAESLDPANVEAQYYLGIVYERFSQPDEAMNRYKRAMDLDRANPQYVVAAAEMLVAQNKLEEADSLLVERRSDFEANAGIRQLQGQIALLRSDPAAAARALREASMLAPDDHNIREDLARAQLVAQQHSDALITLDRLLSIEANRQRRDLRSMRAQALIGLDRLGDARTELVNLTSDQAGTRDAAAWFELGKLCARMNDLDRLRFAAGRVVSLWPNRYEGFMLRGMHASLSGDTKAAIQHLDRAISLTSTDARPLILKAVLLEETGRTHEAVEVLSRAIERDGGRDPRLMEYLAALQLREGTAAMQADPNAANINP